MTKSMGGEGMKVNELIKQLSYLSNKYGDVDVMISQHDPENMTTIDWQEEIEAVHFQDFGNSNNSETIVITYEDAG